MSFYTWFRGLFSEQEPATESTSGNYLTEDELEIQDVESLKAAEKGKPDMSALPTTRQSVPNYGNGAKYLLAIKYPNEYRIVEPEFLTEVIPIIRKLCYTNGDMSQALHNIVTLGNTGHKILFDRNVDDSQVDKMRDHIKNKHKEWAPGKAGANGLVNALYSQLMIGGAIAAESVPNADITSYETVILVPPEDIRFRLSNNGLKYEPYQRITNGVIPANKLVNGNLKKLNPLTFKYYALNGVGELPYGIPPYLPALEPVKDQGLMNENIRFAIKQLGLLGFLEVLVSKPESQHEFGSKRYKEELEAHLDLAVQRVKQGFNDGAIVGYKDDHEINFNSISKDFASAVELYDNNELQLATATKQDASLWGRAYNTSETNITIVFMKMLSEQKNAQNILSEYLVELYSGELRMAGYNFNSLEVVFNPSTTQDALKHQQAREILIRNLLQLYLMGTISEKQFADEAGYEAPDQPKPRVPVELLAGKNPAQEAEAGQKREKGKDASDKKVRDKNKPTGSKKQ